MLYLKPPYHIIDGISVFRDHEDEEQYYFMPLDPHLTVIEDEDTGIEMPQIQLIKYRGEAGSGGFLNFDVNLGVSEDQLSALASAIQAKENLRNEPRMAPVPLLDGYVKLMILGKQTEIGDTEDTTPTPVSTPVDNNQPKFVIDMQHYAKPSLYGKNQAAFSVQLDEAGVVVVEEAIKGNMTPIGIVYALDYMALRDGYKVKVSVNWERVQKHFDESFNVDTPVFSSSISTVVDELIEDRTIDMQVDKLFITDDSTASMEARMDQAVSQVKEMIVDSFFEPSLEPITSEDDDDKVDDAARIGLMLFSAGASEVGGLFSYKKTDITRIDKKKLDVNMSERTAVVRSIYPQGHLQGLFKVLREDGVDLSQFIVPVELDHPWFQKRTINIISRTDFASDNVESLNVTLNYGGDKENVVLDKSKTKETIQWLSKTAGDKVVMPVEVSYEVHFKNVDSMERPTKIASEPQIIEVENFEVRPHDLYGSVPVAIMALDFPWEVYSHIEILLKYTDEENAIKIDENILLNAETKEAVWDLFTLDPDKTTFSYKLIYRAVDHRDLEMNWEETDKEKLIIRDPFPNKRKINFVPAVNWTEVKNVFIDITYEDLENNIREQQSLSFTEADSAPKEVVLQEFKNPEKRIIQYKATLLFADGRILEVPTCQTLADRVFITPQMRGHKIVAVHPSEIPFSSKKIKDVKVQIKFENEAAGLSFNDSFKFISNADRVRYFEYDFVSETDAAYSYQLSVQHDNGMNRKIPWTTSNDEALVLSIN
ncbi:hypothetical protein [Lacinutrix chionoecetis]